MRRLAAPLEFRSINHIAGTPQREPAEVSVDPTLIDNIKAADLHFYRTLGKMTMRRSIVLMLIALGLGETVGSPAIAQHQRPVRKAELISLAQPVTASDPQPTRAESDRNYRVPNTFAVHDLSRQWVAFQMRDALATVVDRSADLDPDDPFARIGTGPGSASVADIIAPVSTITAPAWMLSRDGPAPDSGQYVPGCGSTIYQPTGFLKRDAEIRRRAYFEMMSRIACDYGVPVGLFDAMIIRESRYNATITSEKDAYGLAQLMAPTAAELGVDRLDAEQNLRGGAAYLRRQLDRFGQYHLALGAYNAGPKRIRNGLLPNIKETQEYVADILMNWSRLTAASRHSASPTPVPPPIVPLSGRSATIASF
jgi:hypothetical protein